MTVPFFSGQLTSAADQAELGLLLDEVIDSGQFSQGEQVGTLEQEIADFAGARHAVAVNSATDALAIGLKALGIGSGDEVIVPVYTFFASASSVCHVGARPVFADIEPDTYAINPGAIEERVTGRTRAVMPVHLFCQMADMPAILSVAGKHGLTVMEDSAEAIGMRARGRHAGLFGRAGVFSFFPTKTLGAIGDAGMVITDDSEIAENCRLLRDHGRRRGEPHPHRVCGVNSRMDEIEAAVLRVRLHHLARDIRRRAELVAFYNCRLANLAPRLTTPRYPDRGYQAELVHYVYLVEAERRDDLVDYLKAGGIGTEVYYPTPLHLQPCFRSLGYRHGDFPVAERAVARALALPLYPEMTDGQAEFVCRTIENFYSKVNLP